MELTPKLFEGDLEKTVSLQEEFLRRHLERMNRKAAVVPISGGLDSSTAAALCVRALGRDRVRGLLLKEKQGHPDART